MFVIQVDKRKHFKLFLAFIGLVPAVKWWMSLPESHRRSSLLARWHDRVVFKYIRSATLSWTEKL